MEFKKNKILPLSYCDKCSQTGENGKRRCFACRGMSVAHKPRKILLFWKFPLTYYHLSLLQARLWWNRGRRLILILLWLNFWIWAGLSVYQQGLFAYLLRGPDYFVLFFSQISDFQKLLFWLGFLTVIYLWSRVIREKKHYKNVEKHDYIQDFESSENTSMLPWSEMIKISRRQKLNIEETFTDEAVWSVINTFKEARVLGHREVTPLHLFYTLLSSNRIANVFIRLGYPADFLRKKISDELLFKSEKSGIFPLPDRDVFQILFLAYEEAYENHQDYVSVVELLSAAIFFTPKIQEFLFDLGIEASKIKNVIMWARIRERLYRQYIKYAKVGAGKSKYGLDKAMTAVATPYLNNFSEDMTILARYNHYDPCLAREKETEEIFRVVEGGQGNTVLVGENGTGKMSILEGLAQKMSGDDVPKVLQDKRLVRLKISSLLSGTTPSGAVERINNIFYEIAKAGNIILCIHNIHELFGVSSGNASSLDAAGALAENLSKSRFLTIATTTPEEYAKTFSGTALGNVFTKVDVPEMTEDQAIQVIEAKIGFIEHKHAVFFSYDALEKAVKYSHRFLHDMLLPGSALEVVVETAAFTKNNKGVNSLVTAEEVAKIISDKTGVPVSSVSAQEGARLMRLETEMHKRVIGQDEAVEAIAFALRRARAEIRSQNRPIAAFLFLGNTGVGKTELAKTIAEVYFGGEKKMIRLDMSEYQDSQSIVRLIGAAGQKGSGILTENVRRNPFSLILLDEIEKADKDVLNLFLQVFDDGRLTDSTGKTIDFTNSIIIATSNAGTAYVSQAQKEKVSSEIIKEKLIRGELKQYFRPEFINRFDGIILFKELQKEDLKKIAGLMLVRLAKDLEVKGIEFSFDEFALEFLAEIGFDPEFGARPMRRAVQEKVENKLADFILSGKIVRGSKIKLTHKGEMIIL
ncbi:MAG TPA: ATP-dependent Clp protease ATP-binding subunit [Candidatus Magasanikbacteria bacterium]|nr:ATP-dependent Clp protease ATP-binding subunit [Candidatus Magasanikbacteria bacterium]